MKKLLMSMLAVALLCGCSSTGGSNTGDLSQAKIGVIQLMKHDALDASYEGFKDVLVAGGVSEDNIKYEIAGDVANCTTVADNLVNGGNDLIYAIATPALQAVAATTSDLPIVGCAVTDYPTTKLVASNEAPGGNVTGASDLNPVNEQFDLLTQLLPNAKKVAILYCGSEDNSIYQGSLATKAANDRNLTPKTYTVSDSNDIQSVVQQIIADKNDVIYIPTDNLLATYMSSVEALTSPAGIPIIAGEENMVANGGFATYGLNYYNLGKLAGEQALAILKGEKTPADTPIAFLSAEDCKMVINLKVAAACGLSADKAAYPTEATFIE